ncbi:hypothetical protein GCM10020331_026960 [Ectobacillus funiculus]
MIGIFKKRYLIRINVKLTVCKKIVDQIEELEPQISALSDEQLQAKTPAFKERLTKGETLDDLLPEAFAVVREAAKRVLGMRPYQVQLTGGPCPS